MLENNFREVFLAVQNCARDKGLSIVMYRNYETLPDQLKSGDVDIFCKPEERGPWQMVFRDLARRENCDVFLIWTSYYVDKYQVQMPDGQAFLFDINYRLNWYNVDFGEKLITNTIELSSKIHVLSDEVCFFIAVCHYFLYGGYLPLKYLDRYRSATKSDIFADLMNSTYGKFTPELMMHLHTEQQMQRKKSRKIRTYVLLKHLRKNLFKGVYQVVTRYFWGEKSVRVKMS